MSIYRINGGRQISGEAEPVGNKNSVLKLIAASIIHQGDYILNNVPAISDVEVMLQILESMGAVTEYDKDAKQVKINTDTITTWEMPKELTERVRASIVFVGPILARFGKVKSYMPGGDKIGERELKAHFNSLIQLGAKFEGDEWGEFSLSGKLQPNNIYLYEPSVTATENIIMAASALTGETVIKGAACEPHVQELCTLLNKNGAQIDGIGSNVLIVRGNSSLRSLDVHSIWPDYIDVATLAVAAAITNGELLIKDVRHEDLITINFFFGQLGLKMEERGDNLYIPKDQHLELVDKDWGRIKGIYSQPWYSFPSDLMSIAIVLAMHTDGATLFFEKLYRDRMSFASAFNSAGGNIVTCDPHRIFVLGKTQLKGATYVSPDLRAGMAYLLAGLAAEGQTIVKNIDHISRGYPGTDKRFNELGAEIDLLNS